MIRELQQGAGFGRHGASSSHTILQFRRPMDDVVRSKQRDVGNDAGALYFVVEKHGKPSSQWNK